VHDDAVGLVFNEAAERVLAERGAEIVEGLAGGGRGLLKLAAAVGEEALGSVEAPDLEGWVEREQRAISAAGRPVMIAMRVRPWRWRSTSSSRTPAKGRA
jgi:hypothetical protein